MIGNNIANSQPLDKAQIVHNLKKEAQDMIMEVIFNVYQGKNMSNSNVAITGQTDNESHEEQENFYIKLLADKVLIITVDYWAGITCPEASDRLGALLHSLKN